MKIITDLGFFMVVFLLQINQVNMVSNYKRATWHLFEGRIQAVGGRVFEALARVHV